MSEVTVSKSLSRLMVSKTFKKLYSGKISVTVHIKERYYFVKCIYSYVLVHNAYNA